LYIEFVHPILSPWLEEACSVSFLNGFSAFTVFLAIAAIGFLFLVVSFLFGELFGHSDLGGHAADVQGDMHGVGFFNTRVVSVFITAFGGFGAIGVHLGYRTEISTLIGLDSFTASRLLVALSWGIWSGSPRR